MGWRVVKPSQDWIDDSTRWMGEVLTGKYAHWCPEWDYLTIDETCMEFIACHCYDKTNQIVAIKSRLNAELEKK